MKKQIAVSTIVQKAAVLIFLILVILFLLPFVRSYLAQFTEREDSDDFDMRQIDRYYQEEDYPDLYLYMRDYDTADPETPLGKAYTHAKPVTDAFILFMRVKEEQMAYEHSADPARLMRATEAYEALLEMEKNAVNENDRARIRSMTDALSGTLIAD